MENTKQLSLEQYAHDWLDRKLDNVQIKAEMLRVGFDERNVGDLLKEINKMRYARNTARGLYYILAGAILCLFSCVFTLMSSDMDNTFILYGLTSIGVIIVFIGLMKIFG